MKQHEHPTPEPAAPNRRTRHYLVMAHHEGDHGPVLAKAEELMEEGSARFHILVPATPPRRDGLKDALAAAADDGVIVATAPDGIAERLGLDFVHRLQRADRGSRHPLGGAPCHEGLDQRTGGQR